MTDSGTTENPRPRPKGEQAYKASLDAVNARNDAARKNAKTARAKHDARVAAAHAPRRRGK